MDQSTQSLIKKIEVALEVAQQIPMWGLAKPFPLEAFMEKLSAEWKIPLHGRMSGADWYPSEKALEGMGRDVIIQSLSLSPLRAPLLLAVSKADMQELLSWILDPQQKRGFFEDEDLQKGFYQYLLLKAAQVAHHLQACEDLTPQLGEETTPSQDSYCINIGLQSEERQIWIRLICQTDFHADYKRHFMMRPSVYAMQESEIPLSLNIEVGSSELSTQQWQSVSAGDFLLLDRCSYQPDHRGGTALLTLAGTPIFHVKIKESEVKILEYADVFEELVMDETTNMPSEAEEKTAKLLAKEEIPLIIAVEAGRMGMSLRELLALKPGNILNLPVHPEQGVNLTVNGKVVGRGELLQVGDTLGVKVIEIGS